jgi:signal peptidase I
MTPWIILSALLLVYCATVPQLLQRAGMKPTLGYFPIINLFSLLQITKRPWWWFILLLIPGVNLIMLAVVNVETGIAFGKRSTKDQWFFGALPWIAFVYLAYAEKQQAYAGPRDWTGKKKSVMREWGEAIVFAVVAASVIRTFFLEAFTIPTPSMEKSMLVGDYLFVSKMSYGAKVPQTPVSLPFVHNTMPGSMANSYNEWFSLPYFRLPGFGKVERFDPVVFNFPNGDTIIVEPLLAGHDYHSFLRNEAFVLADRDMNNLQGNYESYIDQARARLEKGQCATCVAGNRKLPIEGIRHRPMDKKENYVKRCIGLPGDNLKIVDRQVYINDAPIENPAGMQFMYDVIFSSEGAYKNQMEKFKVNMGNRRTAQRVGQGIGCSIPLTAEEAEQLKKTTSVLSVEVRNDSLRTEPDLDIYPNSFMMPFATWSRDNFGPIHIPAKGETVELTAENLEVYRRVITAYEGHSLQQQAGQILIDGQPTTHYTFQQDYYWMMGDNRHESLDSRYWGFVPEDHVVGKPIFVWFSKSNPEYQTDTSIRWSRMFRLVD